MSMESNELFSHLGLVGLQTHSIYMTPAHFITRHTPLTPNPNQVGV